MDGSPFLLVSDLWFGNFETGNDLWSFLGRSRESCPWLQKNQCFSKIFFVEKSKPFFYQSLTKKLNSCPNFRIKDNRREAHFNSYFSSACFFGNIIRRWCAQSTPVPPTIKHEYYSSPPPFYILHSHIAILMIFTSFWDDCALVS
jgi:hypothetical protein